MAGDIAVTTLVYAYGCGLPTSGEDHALAEMDRCIQMWDELVAVERVIADAELAQARSDSAEIDAAQKIIESSALPAERTSAFRKRREALAVWRKANKEFRRSLEDKRIAAVVRVRK